VAKGAAEQEEGVEEVSAKPKPKAKAAPKVRKVRPQPTTADGRKVVNVYALDGEATGHLHPVLPIRGEDEVVGLEGQGGADLHRLLSFEHGVSAYPALTLQGEHASVQLPGQDHVPIHLLIEIGVEARVVTHQLTLAIDHPEGAGLRGQFALARNQSLQPPAQT